jgi:hypothetical protein
MKILASRLRFVNFHLGASASRLPTRSQDCRGIWPASIWRYPADEFIHRHNVTASQHIYLWRGCWRRHKCVRRCRHHRQHWCWLWNLWADPACATRNRYWNGNIWVRLRSASTAAAAAAATTTTTTTLDLWGVRATTATAAAAACNWD